MKKSNVKHPSIEYKRDLTEWADIDVPIRSDEKIKIGKCANHGVVIVTKEKYHKQAMECPKGCGTFLVWSERDAL